MLSHAMKKYLALILLLFCLSTPSHSEAIKGEVTRVIDGDTIVIEHRHHPLRIRLCGIDAPEKKQAYGDRAKEELSELCASKHVTVIISQKDRYGRSVGEVFVGDQNINEELLRRGAAWWYWRYSKNPNYQALEEEARNSHRGLWQALNPTPPWVFRREKHK